MRNDIKNNTCHQFKEHFKWKGITLTDSAVKRILQLINEDPNVLGLKITIKKSGCAGLSYKINKLLVLENKYMVYERDGAKLFIPTDVMPLIDGTELDYIQEGLNYSFQFNNPNAQYSCGCGESFNI